MGSDLLSSVMDCVSDHLQGILPDDVKLMFNIDNSISVCKQYRYKMVSLCNLGFTSDCTIVTGWPCGLWTDADVNESSCYHVYHNDPNMLNIIDDTVLFFVTKNIKPLI